MFHSFPCSIGSADLEEEKPGIYSGEGGEMLKASAACEQGSAC